MNKAICKTIRKFWTKKLSSVWNLTRSGTVHLLNSRNVNMCKKNSWIFISVMLQSRPTSHGNLRISSSRNLSPKTFTPLTFLLSNHQLTENWRKSQRGWKGNKYALQKSGITDPEEKRKVKEGKSAWELSQKIV